MYWASPPVPATATLIIVAEVFKRFGLIRVSETILDQGLKIQNEQVTTMNAFRVPVKHITSAYAARVRSVLVTCESKEFLLDRIVKRSIEIWKRSVVQ